MRALQKISVLALLIGGFIASTSTALAQAFPIFGYTNQVWSYNSNDVSATNWKDVGFDDSLWPTGRGSLGYEDTGTTLTSLNTAGATINTFFALPASGSRLTAYFRTHFNIATPTNGISLTFSNRIDDSAVYYLNGVEIFRLGIAAGVTVIHGTFGASTEATTLQIVSTNPATLLQGDNVLAVEVHQTGNTSSDLVLATALSGALAFPASINYAASSLTNRTIAQCTGSTTLSVAAEGSPTPTIQWNSNGVPIVGANAATFAINNARLDQAASYTVTVSNSAAVVTSSPATVVTVTPDLTAPTVLYVLASANLTNITVAFSEVLDFVDPTLGDVAANNFQLTDTNTASVVTIQSAAALGNGMGYLLTTDPLDPTHGYELLMTSSRDACAANVMDNITLPVHSFRSTPLTLTASWKYLQNVVDPGASWFQAGFDDSTWAVGSGPFDMKRGGNYPTAPSNCRSNTFYGLQGPVPTCLDMTNFVTGATNLVVYFRTHFSYSGKTNETILELSGKFDDGTVVYLNNQELTRFGVAAAPAVITGTSVPTRTVNDGDARDTATFIATSALHNGDNLLSVILLQVGVGSSDLTMGLEFNAITLEALAAPTTLHITEAGGSVTVTWSGGGTLQSSADISNPANWVNVPAATSPYTTAAGGAAKFYRVTNP